MLSLAEIRALQTAGGVAHLDVPLLITRDGNNVVLPWTSPEELKPQTTADPSLGNWIDNPTPPVVSGNNRTATVRIAPGKRFYRLAKF